MADKKHTIKSFAAALKAQEPYYADKPDWDLVTRFIKQYPDAADIIDPRELQYLKQATSPASIPAPIQMQPVNRFTSTAGDYLNAFSDIFKRSWTTENPASAWSLIGPFGREGLQRLFDRREPM